jgi:fluoride exporter
MVRSFCLAGSFGLRGALHFSTVDIMKKTILIGLAGLLGTVFRYWLSGSVARKYGETFPLGTLFVNVAGCFLAGSVFYLTEERFLVNPTVRTVILIGFLGGFTTFSSFGLQTFTLMREGEFGLATLNVTVSNLLGLLMVWAGYSLAKAL